MPSDLMREASLAGLMAKSSAASPRPKIALPARGSQRVVVGDELEELPAFFRFCLFFRLHSSRL
jgi:hypothetical protein